MLAGVGASAINSNVSAKRRHVRTHRVHRHHKTHRRRARRTRKRRSRVHHHESLAKWYLNNGKRIARNSVNRSRVFHDAFDNAGDTSGFGYNDGTLCSYWALSNNKGVKRNNRQAWIVGHTYQENNQSFDDLNTSDYANSIEDYNNGVAYLQRSGKSSQGTIGGDSVNGFIFLNKQGEWALIRMPLIKANRPIINILTKILTTLEKCSKIIMLNIY